MIRVTAAVSTVLLLLAGCAGPPGPYDASRPFPSDRPPEFEHPGPQIERGRPFWPLDALNHYLLSLPSKILLLNWKVMDHKLPSRSEQILQEYLDLNALEHVKVRHNQYHPLGEFRRLLKNSDVGPGYRSTLGALAWLRYTLLPDRLFGGTPLGGGDHYNPYTNTINVYSSDPTILLHEGGHAKDFAGRQYRGTYAFTRLFPYVDLIQEAQATTDAVRYFHCMGMPRLELRAYRTLIPAYSTYLGNYLPGGPPVALGTVVLGHAFSVGQAWRRSREFADPWDAPTDPIVLDGIDIERPYTHCGFPRPEDLDFS